MNTITINFGQPDSSETTLNDGLYLQLSKILAEVDITTETYNILLLSANARSPWLEIDIGRLTIGLLADTLHKIAQKASKLGSAIDQYQSSIPHWTGLHTNLLLDNFEHHLFLSEKTNHARFFHGLGSFHYYLHAWKKFIPFLNGQDFTRVDWHLVENDWLPLVAIIRGDGFVEPKSYWHHLNEVRDAALRSQSADIVSQRQAQLLRPKEHTALLLVAVVTERRALLEELSAQGICPIEQEIGGRYVDSFTMLGREGLAWRVIVGQSTEKGPHAAQALIQDFIRQLNLTVIMLVGMCGGLPEHGATETSVIVARQVSNYEPARLREGHSPWSPTTYRGSARITDLANALAARNTLPDLSIMTNKDYGSGEKLIDDLSSDLRRNLLALSGDLVGFEMEGPGMLHGLWELQRSNIAIQAAMIKGVSDFGNGQMQQNKEERQVAATRRAVRLALEILRGY